MEDYRLEQSGQEVQDILNGAAMQTDLTAEAARATDAEQTLQGHIDDEELRAKGAESTLQDHIDDEAAARQGADSTLQDHIDAEETRAKAAEKQNADDIDLIEEKIPSAASSSNQLADKAFVNSSIATATATFRGTFNLVSDLHLTLEATEQQIATALAGAIATADNNDYAFIQIPTSDETPTQIAEIDRYKYNGSAWAFEYALNNSGFTAAQWAAINSTVTSGDMTKLRALPTNAELNTLLNGLQGGIDDEETRAKAAELALQGAIDDEETRAKGVELSLQGAIGDEETARQGADSTLQDNIDAEETRAKAAEKQNADDIDLIEEKIPSAASSSNQLATASDVSDLSAAIEAILLLIPSAASSLNQLADKAFVNSSIATATATFRGTYNLVTDLGLTILATHAQIETALAGEISTADNNDYCFVQIPTSADTPTEIAKTERYKYNGSEWAYEYDLNNSGYTAAQWAAINSGITSALVTKLSALPTNADITTALGALTDGIDTINEKIPSAASISNKLVDTSALESYVTQVINAIDATFNVTSTDGHVNVQITQVNGVITAVSVNTSDIASADALTVIGGRVTTAEGNITSLAGRVSTNETDIAQLLALYEALTESKPEIIQPTDTWPVASPSEGVIYRVVDRVNTPPEYYSDYMWNGATMVLMATYDNAIDDEPTPGSNNLVKSGGVASNIVFDISRYHATGSTLATYADLAAALGTNGENVPADIRRGGMSIKFVQTDDNKYVQARCMAQNFTIDVTQWQGIDDEPTAGSDNLVTSNGICNALNKITVRNELATGFNDGSTFSGQGGNRINTTAAYTDVELSPGTQYGGIAIYTSKLRDKTVGDVYYFAIDCKADYDGYIGIGERVNTIPYYGNSFMRVRKASNNFFRLSQNLIINTFGTITFFYGVIARQTAGICSYQNPVVINLTKIFGAGNEPSAEYIDSWINDIIIPINGQVQLPYLDSNFISKDSVVIAGSNVNVPNAIKCTGYCDEFTINNYINNSNIKTITLAKGSIFNLAGAISIVNKQSKTIDGNDCDFVMENATEMAITGFRRAGNNVDWIVLFDANNPLASNFVAGQYVEIYNPDATQNDYTTHASAVILYSAESNTQIRLSSPTDTALIESYAFSTGAKMKNVSSIFDVRNSTNILVKNVRCDSNVANNTISYDTFMAQNGIHFYKCTGCKVLNGSFVNGGRHGILVSSSQDCEIKSCYLNTWGEHCIDLSFHNTTEAIQMDYKLNAIVDSCKCSNASIYGIQLHRGSNCKVINNYCYNNRSGIGLLEGAKNNIITNNHLFANSQDGVYGNINIENCLFINNIIFSNNRNGIELENNCTFNVIYGNICKEHVWNGIRIISGSKNTIQDNTIENPITGTSSNHIYGIQLKGSTLCYCHDNYIVKGTNSNMTYGVGESDSSDKNIVKNNISINVDSVLLIGQNSLSDGNVRMNE